MFERDWKYFYSDLKRSSSDKYILENSISLCSFLVIRRVREKSEKLGKSPEESFFLDSMKRQCLNIHTSLYDWIEGLRATTDTSFNILFQHSTEKHSQ